MAQNYLYATRESPFQSFLQGFGAGQNIIGNMNQQQMIGLKNQMLQQEFDKQQAVRNALADYGQPGFDANKAASLVMPHDPEMGIKMMNLQRSMNKEQLDSLTSVAKLAETYGPMLLSNPKMYPQFKGMVDKIMPGNMLPGIESFADKDGNFDAKGYTGFVSMLVPEIRKEAVKPETYSYHERPMGDGRTQGSLIGNKGTVQDIPGSTGFKGSPQILVPEGGRGQAMAWYPGQPIPPGYGPVRQFAGAMSPENMDSVLKGLKTGDIWPSMLSKRGADYNNLIGEAQRSGINLTKLATEEASAKSFARNMNTGKMNQFRMFASTVNQTIGRVRELANEMNLGGFRPLNYIEIEGLAKTAGNTPMGKLATAYVTQVNGLKEELGQIANAGYAPTESVWKLVNSQINKNFGVNQMHTALDEVERLIKYRVTALNELGPMGGQPATPGQTSPQQTQGSAGRVPDAIIPKLKSVQRGTTVDGGDGYLYRVGADGVPERTKK